MRKRQNEVLFLVGSVGYPILELIWRRRTHYSMALAGGICMVLINLICCERLKKKKIILRAAAGSGIITSVELVLGLIFNGAMGLDVWDYSNMPLNFMGQICLPYSLLWCAAALPAMKICRAAKRFKICSGAES